ncbi:rhodanese-like domain-containing protein [Bdellovibrionota bacterium FG-2]
MNLETLQPYILPVLIAAFFARRHLKSKKVRAMIPKLMSEGAVIVDVRTAAEFASGAKLESRNIPMQQLDRRVAELDPSKPVIVCCASGSRSAMAAVILKRHGFKNVLNAGAWTNVP